MKKTLLITLAGLMLIAFTQCNKGSKEYRDAKKQISEMKKAYNNAKDCEDLLKALGELSDKYDNQKYEDKDKMTKEEEEKLAKEFEGLEKEMEEKTEKLCGDFFE